jgi:hypothetical protein
VIAAAVRDLDAADGISALATDTALIDGAIELPVIFDRRVFDAAGALQSNRAGARFAAAAYPDPGARIGDVLVIRRMDWKIVAWAEGSDDAVQSAILERVSEEI